MARRLNWEGSRDCLRRLREDHVRDSELVVRLWEECLMNHREKLGDELWTVYEQVCIAALDCQRLDLSEICLELLHNKFPDSVRVKRLLGMRYEAEKKFVKAEEVYQAIIDKDESNMFVRKRLVTIAKEQNEVTKAIELLNKYLEQFMTDFEGWLELCDLYLSQLDYSKACYCMEELIMSNPHNHLFYQKFAEIKYTMGDPESMAMARSYYAQAIKLNPKNVRALYGLFLSSSNLALTASKGGGGKEKQNNIKNAAWAAQQLNERYQTDQPKEMTEETRVVEAIEKVLESLTEKTSS
ncbi:ER membrane protein complex subunit 2-like [Mytilus edulis]|uniref:ER membrane protein complex subunit 2-like n=1 Tax=Mytilus edulis TaxID=6550 RepID=UPI0039F02B59